jgi:multiple sugar transport system ATP-binding protein
MEVVLDRLTKQFQGKDGPAAVSGINLQIARGEFVVVVGPSGCGKSTTLRMIAGLEEPDSGELLVGGKSMKDVPPQDRDLAMVFQGYALYPQMSVREILEFPLKMRGVPRQERSKAADEAAALLRIDKLMDRRPAELSGGERQRVAMGRAIVRKPRVFLFDEPLSNLDAALREGIRLEIGALVRRLGATAIYVTHDHVEAMTLADKIAVMKGGTLLQFAPPREIYEQPASAFVGTFLGSPRMNLAPAEVDVDTVHIGPFRVPSRGKKPHQVGIRPEHVKVGEGDVEAEVIALEPLGAETHLVIRAGELELRARAPGFYPAERGGKVRVSIDAGKVHLFDEDGARIAW